jgi:hypothetical protein
MTQEPDTVAPSEVDIPTAVRDAATSQEPIPAFGWTPYAERINGRFAMIGFVALLVLELVTRQDFITWLGF